MKYRVHHGERVARIHTDIKTPRVLKIPFVIAPAKYSSQIQVCKKVVRRERAPHKSFVPGGSGGSTFSAFRSWEIARKHGGGSKNGAPRDPTTVAESDIELALTLGTET